MEKLPNSTYTFPVIIYGNLVPFNDVISKARVRIFYKGLNRNNTYITEEFAEKLLSTLSYSPIIGIYDGEDFTDHGNNRNDGKAYGVVPENPNVAWEENLDPDGVTRVYACADVLLWTARYAEAKEIPNKSQSMELYEKSIKGEWIIDPSSGRKVFKFTDGSFIGLTALGDKVEPCFEGASFYNLIESSNEMIMALKAYSKAAKNIGEGGEKKMQINFKLSDREKYDAIWCLLNTNYNEEHQWEVRYSVLDIYDEYALVYDYENKEYLRVNYSKNDENNEVTLGDMVKTFITDVSEAEMNALKSLKSLNNDSFEMIDQKFLEATQSVEILTNALQESNNAIEEAKNSMIAYTTTIATLEAAAEVDKNNIETLTSERDGLLEYKVQKELEEKTKILNKYADKLETEIVENFTQKLEEYSMEDLIRDIKVKLVDCNPEIFSKKSEEGLVYNNYSHDNNHLSSAAKLIEKYRKNKQNGGDK